MATKRPDSAEVHPGPGFRVRTDYPRHPRELIDRLARFDAPTISDRMNRIYSLDSGIQCLTKTDRIAGSICTVNVYPGDNLMVHKALDVARRGDVVMVNAHGAAGSTNAVLGDMVATKAVHRGIAGYVVDGLVRDLPGIIEAGIPVFARGTTAMGPLHRGPGEINYPIAVGGVVANPGDVLVADRAGIVVIPHAFVTELVGLLEGRAAQAEAYWQELKQGRFSNAWVDQLLADTKCLFE